MNFNFELTVNIIQLGLILIILGLLLNNWKPPIKDQYTFLILAFAGIGLGHLLGAGIYWGFIGAGLVFYKAKLVEELKLVKESLKDIRSIRLEKPKPEEEKEQAEI